ncbi:MAG: hypothetical protein HND52_20690 [Ignavibacteriae bacterium]|nr:hypothetical protein [Ignavibacteriota bacterium]NOH00390.1 hypothetical protein [Ignavibacteriota bacterium]
MHLKKEKRNMDSDHLPLNWSWVKLGDIGKIVSGGTPSTKIHDYFNGDIAWITPADLTGYSNKYISSGRRNLSELGLKNSSARLMPKGSILFSSRAPIGYVVIASNEISTNQGFKNLIPNEKVFNEFVFYYLKASRQLAEQNASGTTFKEISSKNFSKLPIPLPPLKEQHNIVEKVEELFSELDNGIENLKKAKEQIKTYRQAVLKFAFEGKLTNGKSEKAKGKGENGELPEGWKWVQLNEVCDKIQDGSHYSPQKKYPVNDGSKFLYLTSKNIRNNYLTFEKTEYVDKEFHNSIYPRCNPEYGDILLTKDGANTGNVTTNTLDEEFSLLSSVCLIKPSKDMLLPNFLKYYIQSPIGFKEITGSMTGTAIKRIILKRIKSAKISLPDIKLQNLIVQEIESRFSVADKMEQSIDESLQKAESLRQSILKQAFEGKLIQQIQEGKGLSNFQRMQVIGAVIKVMDSFSYKKGEMIIAKFIYLVDKLYKLNLNFNYKQWHFGPYSPEIKKLLNTRSGYFNRMGTDAKSFYTLTKEEKLFSYPNPLVNQVKEKLPNLTKIFSKYKVPKERDHKIELLASVCKVIEDEGTNDLTEVYQALKQWKTSKTITGFNNKAEKFSLSEVERALNFIDKQEWFDILA